MSLSNNSEALFYISKKERRRIIGLMSGTSLDGLDCALCTFKNHGSTTEINIEHFKTVSYSEDVKSKIKSVFCKETVNLQDVCVINAWLGDLHGKIVSECLEEWNVMADSVDLIASHGQTIFHCPKSLHKNEALPNSTLQIGDGDHISKKTGIITVSDFRQKHVAAGGEGAPLALYGDFLIFSKKGENRIMLNIGGISNITCLFGDGDANKAFASDLGPGNTLIDAYVRIHFGADFDFDGEIANKGKVNSFLLLALKNHPFFSAPFPKTTGPELFNLIYLKSSQISSNTEDISSIDVVSTLTRFSAEIIAEGITRTIISNEPFHIYGSGGGVHNKVLMNHLSNLLPKLPLKLTDDLGISGDAKEAILFATLANETVCGQPIIFGSTIPSITMGKVSFPR